MVRRTDLMDLIGKNISNTSHNVEVFGYSIGNLYNIIHKLV